jgi:short-subunit dehydrogenase
MKQSAPFYDNVVVITGASRGIGREMALLLSEQGAKLVLAARDIEKTEETAAACRERGGEAVAIPTDVSRRDQCETLIRGAVAAFGRIDTLMNNAGITMRNRLDELRDPTVIEEIMRVNYLGSAHCAYYALPYLKSTKGRIVAISSFSGKWGLPRVSGYSASKHALAGFFDSLRIELSESGVSVTVVYPGFVATRGRESGHGILSVESCARAVVDAAARRKRELFVPSLGRAALWFKLIAPPSLFDRFLKKVMDRPEAAI